MSIKIENILLKCEEQKKGEPKTVKVITGSGDIHLYFTYNDELKSITSKDHCFGKDYDIDVKTNGGCVICPPTSYFNNNVDDDIEYVWAGKEFYLLNNKIAILINCGSGVPFLNAIRLYQI